MTQDNQSPPPDDEWTSDEHSKLMSRYERIAAESAGQPSKDGKSVVAEFSLGGSVPRHEPSRQKFQSKDIYIRLENTIYGPVTQEELAEMLASGELTGFESASADLQHWTPLIYHPKMTLSGEVDPDATHGMLHDRSTLPTASRAPAKFDLEALADMDDDEPLPASMPLAAILIKPIKVSRKTGLPIPVHADLEKESLEEVRQRTDITESSRLSGSQALVELARANEARLGDTDEIPLVGSEEGEAIRGTDSGWDPNDGGAQAKKATGEITGASTKPASEQMSALVDAEIEALYAGMFDGEDAGTDEPGGEEAAAAAPDPAAWDDPDDRGSIDIEIEIDDTAVEVIRNVSAEEPLPDSDGDEPVAEAAPPASTNQGGQLGAYLIGLLILAVGAVVVMALLTQSTPSAPHSHDAHPPSEGAPEGAQPAVEGSAEAPGGEAAPAGEAVPAGDNAPTEENSEPNAPSGEPEAIAPGAGAPSDPAGNNAVDNNAAGAPSDAPPAAADLGEAAPPQ